LHFLQKTGNAPFHIPRVGNAGGRLKENIASAGIELSKEEVAEIERISGT
jgi:diketogulonate reductase-like aldo/keto reductase